MNKKIKPPADSQEFVTSYINIKRYSTTLYNKLKAASIPLGLTDFPMLINMDIDPSVDGLGMFIGAYTRIVAIPGIDDNNNFTISFLGLRSNGTIDTLHPGQETWPPLDITKLSSLVNPPLP